MHSHVLLVCLVPLSAGYPIHVEICARNNQILASVLHNNRMWCCPTHLAHGVILLPGGEVSKEGLNLLQWGIHYTATHETEEGKAGRGVTETI